MTDELNLSKTPGRFGAREATLHDELQLSRFVSLLAPPSSWDQTLGVTNQIGMMGNADFGCCVEAGFFHGELFKALLDFVNGKMTFEPGFRPAHAPFVETIYWAYQAAQGIPGRHPDEGTDPGAFAKWVFEQNMIDAYAQVDAQPIQSSGFTELKAAAVAFNGVLLCINVPKLMQQQFANGKTLTGAGPDNPLLNEGHGIWLCGFDDATQLVKIATWGNVVYATYEFIETCLTSAWVYVTRQDAQKAGANIEAMVAAIQSLPDAEVEPGVANETFLGGAREKVDSFLSDDHLEKIAHQAKRVVELALQREAVNVVFKEIVELVKIALKADLV